MGNYRVHGFVSYPGYVVCSIYDYSNYGGLVVGTMEYQASESGSNPL